MSPLGELRVGVRTESGVFLWVSGMHLVAITEDQLLAKRFETQTNREKAARKIQAGEPAKSAIGMLTKTFSLDSIRNVCLVPDLGVLVVRGGRLKEPLRLEFPDHDAAAEIFATLHAVCPTAGDVQSGKASVNDVPLDPQLGLAILFGLLGIACVVSGAFETGPIQGWGKAQGLGKLGQWLGPIPAILIGVVALAAMGYFTLIWWRNLPEKQSFDTSH